MVHLGLEGYTSSCRSIVGSTKSIIAGIKKDFPELYVLGDPLVSVVAFGSKSLKVYEVGDRMGALGWHRTSFFPPLSI
jgi:sphinganine-1-phosphate aldolase